MAYGRNYDRAINKKKWDEMVRRPRYQETRDDQWKTYHTNYSQLSLGVGEDGECKVTQEERENHFHLIGTTGEGKSMLLLRMLMSDIDRIANEEGPGVCFIDGSEEGDTITRVLGYCEHIGFKRIILIDPYKKITPLNPIHTAESLVKQSVENLTEAFQIVFGSDPAQTAYIETYLPLLFRVLSSAGMTLGDLEYFVDFALVGKREQILDLSTDEYAVSKLNFAYQNTAFYLKEVGSSMRRLGVALRNERLQQMLSHRKGLDFAKLIADRWLILVNVSEMKLLPARLLSSIVISEVIFGLKRLRANYWEGYEYLYIDEAARFATSQVADILEQMRKIGLRLILSHQHMGQFDDMKLAKSIRTNAKTKIAFYVADRDERDQVVRMMYGGDLSDREVSYALSQQQKQTAVVKLGKDGAKIIKIHDTPVYKVSQKFIDEIYSSPWYYPPEEVEKDIYDRFRTSNTTNASGTSESNQRPNSQGPGGQTQHHSGKSKKAGGQKADIPKGRVKRNSKWEKVRVPPKGTEGSGGGQV